MILYTIFDTTIPAKYALLFSSNNIEDIYNKAKSFLEMDIDYNEFVDAFKMKQTGQYVYESETNFKSILILITVKDI